MSSIGSPVCIAPVFSRCGEGAVWHAAEKALYWCDINGFLIHRFDTNTNSVRSWFFDQPVTALVLTDRDNTLAVSLASKLIFWEPATDARRDHGFQLPDWPKARFNDGRADRRGSLWLGSMSNNVAPDGSPLPAGGTDGILYRIDPDGTETVWRKDVGISNTVAWSPDQSKFYFADTLANALRVYDFDAQTGAISNEKPFLMGFERGLPDGSSVDSEGFIWNCRYDGGCIVRVAPNGKIDRVIEMPASKVTTCTFGGDNLSTLFVTTAALGAPASERLAGGLFAIETDVRGQPENRFCCFKGMKR